jgi:hypothetical protein
VEARGLCRYTDRETQTGRQMYNRKTKDRKTDTHTHSTRKAPPTHLVRGVGEVVLAGEVHPQQVRPAASARERLGCVCVCTCVCVCV